MFINIYKEDKVKIPALYRIKYEVASLHEKLHYRMIVEELAIKYEKLQSYRKQQKTIYINEMEDVHNLLKIIKDLCYFPLVFPKNDQFYS